MKKHLHIVPYKNYGDKTLWWKSLCGLVSSMHEHSRHVEVTCKRCKDAMSNYPALGVKTRDRYLWWLKREFQMHVNSSTNTFRTPIINLNIKHIANYINTYGRFGNQRE